MWAPGPPPLPSGSMTLGASTGGRAVAWKRWAPGPAVALAALTLAVLGFDGDAFAWAAAQAVLVGIAAYDLATRRIPNRVTVPASVLALSLRAAFERSALTEVLVAGAAAFAVFYILAILFHGGLGMGDVKLAGLLGCLLGAAVLPGLLIGVLAGGVGPLILVLRSRTALRRHIAYGPYLAFGGAVAILAFNPPRLI
jgi:leader peptidase (prepilin peptidase)/N-methyltransferase